MPGLFRQSGAKTTSLCDYYSVKPITFGKDELCHLYIDVGATAEREGTDTYNVFVILTPVSEYAHYAFIHSHD